jgi:hypothetical protein
MTASRLLLTLMLVPSVALPIEAQQLAPVALRASDVGPITVLEWRAAPPLTARPAPADTVPEPERPVSATGTIVGGVLGGAIGAFAGMAIGAATAEGCHGEFCGLTNVVLGLAIGESLGVGVGSHAGSRSRHHANIVLTTVTSAAILVAGTMAGVAMQQGGAVMIPLTPAMQLAAAWAIENR